MRELERSAGDGTSEAGRVSGLRSPLLASEEPLPVSIVNPMGTSPFLLVGDHAGKLIPAALGSLGLGEGDLLRHIGWDIGVGLLGEMLAEKLDAVFVRQRYSRLVIDCNRDPGADTAIPPISDGTPVPGNNALSATQKAARIASFHEPYHGAIAAELKRRHGIEQQTIFVSLHSFTPALRTIGGSRPWQIGVLHDLGDVTFAKRLLQVLRTRRELVVGENEPYSMTGIDYTVPRHTYAAGLPYVELEIRQDLLEAEADVRSWSDLLVVAFSEALQSGDAPSQVA